MPNFTVSERSASRRDAPPQARSRGGWGAVPALVLALAGCAVLSALSLALPFTLVFDPWGWLIWARELGEGGLDTSAGPSWKPLPVLLALPFAGFEQLGPQWWLWLARTGWLAAPVLAGLLAARLVDGRWGASATRSGNGDRAAGESGVSLEGAGAGRGREVGRRAWVAGTLAAAGTLLLYDPFTAWVRQFTGGLSEPLLSALVLGAILAASEERPRLTALLAFCACLLRPEAWPFAALWALWAVRSGRLSLAAGLAGAALIPLAWFVPDLLGAGDPLAGAERAREGSGAPPVEALEVLGRALALVPAALWLGAVWLLVGAWRRRREGRAWPQDEAALVLGVGALTWIAVVAVLASAGYAGLPRFMAPAGALLCALGAAGVVRGFGVVRDALWGPGFASREAALAGDGSGSVADAPASGNADAVPVRRPGAHAPRRRALLGALALLAVLGCGIDIGLRLARVPGELNAARSFATGVDELFTLADQHGDEVRACPPVATSDLYTLTALAWRLELPLPAVTYSGHLYPRRGTAILGPNPPPGVRTQARLRAQPFATEGRWEAYRAGPCGGERGRGAAR